MRSGARRYATEACGDTSEKLRYDARPDPTREHGRRRHVAIGTTFEIARRMERIAPERAKIVERVVAVAGSFAADNRARFPVVCRDPQHLHLAENGRAVVDRVSGDIVLGEAVTIAPARCHADRQPLGQRPGHAPPNLLRAEIAEWRHDCTGPFRQRRPDARDIYETAERVTSEQGALRTAHELNLFHVEEINARRVGMKLRDAIDIRRDRGISRTRADATKTREAQFRAENSEKYVLGA